MGTFFGKYTVDFRYFGKEVQRLNVYILLVCIDEKHTFERCESERYRQPLTYETLFQLLKPKPLAALYINLHLIQIQLTPFISATSRQNLKMSE